MDVVAVVLSVAAGLIMVTWTGVSVFFGYRRDRMVTLYPFVPAGVLLGLSCAARGEWATAMALAAWATALVGWQQARNWLEAEREFNRYVTPAGRAYLSRDDP
jgi:hypothetical protein